MHLSPLLAATASLLPHTLAHPGPHHQLPRAEILRRADLSARCSNHVAQFNSQRWHKRNGQNLAYQATMEAPHTPYYETIRNETCVLTPEVTEGPYVWPRSQTLRRSMHEDQPGIPLWLDIGVLDMGTCEPLPNVLVDFWHCNATGSYSSFTGLSPDIPFDALLDQLNVTDWEIGKTDLHTDETTFLRGMWPTDTNGIVEMETIFPGFYVTRAIHIHVKVHVDWFLYENGTIANSKTVSTGQLYFDEALEQQIMALEPYASHTQINRTTHEQDSFFSDSFDGGYSPMISIVPIDGQDVTKGMVGYATIGVDTSAEREGAF